MAQWTARTDITYTVHYYLEGTTTKLAKDKVVEDQTFGTEVTEKAIEIDKYKALDPTSVTITLKEKDNEIIFEYASSTYDDEVVVTISGVQTTVMYNGQYQNVIGFIATSNNAEYSENINDDAHRNFRINGTIQLEAGGTNVGTYSFSWYDQIGAFENINPKFTNVRFRVNPNSSTNTVVIIPRTVTLTSESDQKIYDGTPLTNPTVNIGGNGFAAGEGATFNVTGSRTEVGVSDNTFTYALTAGTSAGNYNITTVFGTLTVIPGVTLTANSGIRLYDATEQTVTGYTSSVPGLTFTGATAVGRGTDSGNYEVVLTGVTVGQMDDSGRYMVTEIRNGTLTITPRSILITSGSGEKDYDGEALTNDEVTITGDGFVYGHGVDVTVTGSQTEVGSSENTFTYELTGGANEVNYNVATQFGTLSVTQVTRELEDIDDDDTPLAGPATWALINLIAMIFTVCIAVGMIVTYFRKKDGEEEKQNADGTKRELTDEEQEENERRKSKFFGLIPGIGSVITFFLTEDMSAKMVLTDRWTILMIAILVIGAALGYLTRNEKDKEEEKPEQA